MASDSNWVGALGVVSNMAQVVTAIAAGWASISYFGGRWRRRLRLEELLNKKPMGMIHSECAVQLRWSDDQVLEAARASKVIHLARDGSDQILLLHLDQQTP